MTTYRSHLNNKLKDPKFRHRFNQEKRLLDLAIQVQESREKQGLSQTELAEIAGITQQQLSRLESGTNCNVSTLLKVCQALNIRVTLKPETQKASV